MAAPDIFSFLAGGEMGRLMRAHDWSRSPLGAPESWPQSLRSVVGLMLESKFPMFVAWGPKLGFLYNDAYSEILGAKHPAALGARFDAIWAEIWSDISPIIDAALAGRASYHEDLPLTIHRRGMDERAWFTFSYSPLRDEGGEVAGMFCTVHETSGRVRAERAIAAEGRRFAELFEQTPAFMARLRGPDHVFDLANAAYHRLIGGRDVIGRTVADALPEAAEQGFIDLLDRVYRTGEAYVADGALYAARSAPDAPSEEHVIDFVFQPIADPSGATTGILVHGVDVTDARRAGEALRESEDHYRHAVELDPQTTWTSAPDGQLDRVNQRWFEWTGTTGLGSSYADGLHPDDRGRTFDVWGRSVATGEPYDIEHRVRMRDGSHRWMHSRAFARRDEAGRIVKWYGTTEDVHDRRSAEERLLDETRTLETLNRVGAALAGELDLERLVQMVTDAGVELTGARFGAYFHNIMDETGERLHLYTLSGAERADFEKMGRPRATAVFGPTFRNEGVVRAGDILADPRYGRSDPHRGMPEGHLPVRSYLAVPVASRGGEVLGGLLFGHPEPGRFTDRHERLMLGVAAQAAVAIDNARLFQQVQQAKETLESRVAERTLALEQAHDALRQSQKMEAVGQLTGGIAHDFNNMLAVVIGSLDLLGRRLPDGDPRARRYLDAAADGAKRAAQLTQRLLAFSRQQPLRPEPLDASRLIGGMADLLRHSIGADVRLETDLDPELWRTHADPNQLENAILNLAVNARDAMPDGGRLTVRTRNRCDTEQAGEVEHVAITVTDTGSGMSPEVIAKAFDPFFTTKDVGKGTGLGLSQVYGFVKQSGGHVDIRSEQGRGTSIEILLPRYAGAAANAAEPAERSALELGEREEVVLVVEDEPGVRRFSAEALGELGYRVLEADGAAAALRLIDAHPEIALLFTDVVMPEVNGAKLAEEARRRRPDLKVLFTTGYTRDAVVQDGRLRPGVELLGKPYTVEQLATKVRGVLDEAAC